MFFSLASISPISSFTTSRNLFFGLSLFLSPCNSISITLIPTYPWSLLMTCPCNLSLLSLIFILFISATSISFTCFFVIITVSSPYIIVGLTTELYTFPFTLAGNLLLQITPDTFLHLFHSACTLFFTSLSQLPLYCTVDPKYLNSFTLFTFWSSISLFCRDFLHLRTDIWSLTDLLSFLFFPTHTSSILISAPLLPWSLRKSQYHQQTASSMVFLSLLSPLAYPNQSNGLNADPRFDLETFCSSYGTPHHCFASLVHILYK